MAAHGKRKRAGAASVICRILGIFVIAAVIAAILPVTLPRLMGYEIYNVESGSMEPEIPIGSVAYVEYAEPESLEEEEIIAFKSGGSVIIHRVVSNHMVEGLLVTKGDANEHEDFSEVPYQSVIGRVVKHLPILGQFMMILTGVPGKVLLLALILCGVFLNLLAGRLRNN